MKVRCCKYGEPDTAVDVEVEDFDLAPDEFVYRAVAMRAGDVVFIEALDPPSAFAVHAWSDGTFPRRVACRMRRASR